MQFQQVFFRYVTTADVAATVEMGTDADPTSVYGTPGTPPTAPGGAAAANVDNILSCRISGASAPVAVTRIAVATNGPTGATSPTGKLYVWDSASAHWYCLSAAPVALPLNQVVFFDALSPCELPPNTANGRTGQGGADYMLVVTKNVAPTAGQYSFAMTAIQNTP